MFIQTEQTADPATLRFLPGRAVVASGPVAFEGAEAAGNSPLARRLFAINGVEKVEFGSDYVAITKAEPAKGGMEWIQLKPMALAAIMDHFMTGLPAVNDDEPDKGDGEGGDGEGRDGELDGVACEISDLIASRIRPVLREQGGDIEFLSFDEENGEATLAMMSANFGAPTFGIKVKVENTLKHYVPEVTGVIFERMKRPEETQDRPGLRTPEAEEIRALLDERINPAIAAHGGYIHLVDIDDNVAYVRLEGGCQGCGMSDVTLKQGVEVEIMRAVPSIKAVRDITDHASGANPYYHS